MDDTRLELSVLAGLIRILLDLQKAGTKVQSVICHKSTFSSAAVAAKWVKAHGFKSTDMLETADNYRFRQMDPGACKADSFATISVTTGVQAVICQPKKKDG